MAQSPAIKAERLRLETEQALKKASANLARPEVITESPTGDFFVVGMSQSFDFPTVYANRTKTQSARIQLGEQQLRLKINMERREAGRAFVEAQYAQAVAEFCRKQDSLWQAAAAAAERLFAGGQIDALEKQLAAQKASESALKWTSAVARRELAFRHLAIHAGVEKVTETEPLSPPPKPPGLPGLVGVGAVPAEVAVAEGQVLLAERAWKTAKSEALPGFTLGFFNQGLRNAPFQNWLRAGVTVPLWGWQEAGRIKSAKLETQSALAEIEAVRQSTRLALIEILGQLEIKATEIETYRNVLLPNGAQLRAIARQLFEGGQSDMRSYLYILAESMAQEAVYWETVFQANQLFIDLQFYE